MKRVGYYVSDLQAELLDEESKKLDISGSEIVRRSLDLYFALKNPANNLIINFYTKEKMEL